MFAPHGFLSAVLRLNRKGGTRALTLFSTGILLRVFWSARWSYRFLCMIGGHGAATDPTRLYMPAWYFVGGIVYPGVWDATDEGFGATARVKAKREAGYRLDAALIRVNVWASIERANRDSVAKGSAGAAARDVSM